MFLYCLSFLDPLFFHLMRMPSAIVLAGTHTRLRNVLAHMHIAYCIWHHYYYKSGDKNNKAMTLNVTSSSSSIRNTKVFELPSSWNISIIRIDQTRSNVAQETLQGSTSWQFRGKAHQISGNTPTSCDRLPICWFQFRNGFRYSERCIPQR